MPADEQQKLMMMGGAAILGATSALYMLKKAVSKGRPALPEEP